MNSVQECTSFIKASPESESNDHIWLLANPRGHYLRISRKSIHKFFKPGAVIYC
jgi:hypothetical protein